MSPEYIMIRQKYPCSRIDDIEKAVNDAVSSLKIDMSEVAGSTIGIAVGSRGIANIAIIVKSIVGIISLMGGTPVIFAAMGSHGNGTAEGQREILEALGITEEYTGAKIMTCGDSVFYGNAENGQEVYGNPLALTFDKVILINRIKMHTDFEDITESGLCKLMAIGIGNHIGAQHVHDYAFEFGYGITIRAAAKLMMKKLNILFGLAVTENWKSETDHIEAVRPDNIIEREVMLLQQVKEKSIHLPADIFDTLIIEEAGKNISGTNIDTKIIGRIKVPGQREPQFPAIRTIALLNLRNESHGNALGIGLADVITQRLFEKIDFEETMLNGITSNCLAQGTIPCVAPNDKVAINTAYRASMCFDESKLKGMYIKNTSSLEYLAVTKRLYEELKVIEMIEAVSDLFRLEFDEKGGLINKIA